VACLVVSSLSILGYFNYQKTKCERRIITMGQPIPPDPPSPPGFPIFAIPEEEALESSVGAQNPHC
jgi:hypothetical protein